MTTEHGSSRRNLQASDRLIVALDVPSGAEALALVRQLGGLVSFYKVGLELLVSFGLADLLQALVKEKHVFLDLKLPSDIPATVRSVVRSASEIGVKFLTLSHSAERATLGAALEGRGGRSVPELLAVPALSSFDETDFAQQTGRSPTEFRSDFLRRAREAKSLGADGFIVSGQEIALLREAFPDAPLVSPGIRPSWAATDDHKRVRTPAEAILLGADYIVVGRPVRNAPDPRDAVKKIVDEIASALSGEAAAIDGDVASGGATNGSRSSAEYRVH